MPVWGNFKIYDGISSYLKSKIIFIIAWYLHRPICTPHLSSIHLIPNISWMHFFFAFHGEHLYSLYSTEPMPTFSRICPGRKILLLGYKINTIKDIVVLLNISENQVLQTTIISLEEFTGKDPGWIQFWVKLEAVVILNVSKFSE